MKKDYRVKLLYRSKIKGEFGKDIDKVLCVDSENELDEKIVELKSEFTDKYDLVYSNVSSCELSDLIKEEEFFNKIFIVGEYIRSHKELFDEDFIKDYTNLKIMPSEALYYDALVWSKDIIMKALRNVQS